MFDDNPYFEAPKNKEAKIWRYMSLEKFISLLSKKALYFCNSTCFEDLHEGAYTKLNIEVSKYVDEIAPIDGYTRKMREQNLIYRENVHINCWHLSEYESVGMWKNYLDSNMGVAIKSTYNRLVNAVMESPQMVFIGKVKYIDYDKELIPYDEGLWAPFLRKRKVFEYEKEIRAMYLLSHNKIDDTKKTRGGLVNVDLDLLVEDVVLAPDVPYWFREVVESVISKYGYEFMVKNSSVNESPIF